MKKRRKKKREKRKGKKSMKGIDLGERKIVLMKYLGKSEVSWTGFS